MSTNSLIFLTCGLTSLLLFNLLVHTAIAAPISTQVGQHTLEERSLGQCVEIYAVTSFGEKPVSVDREGKVHLGADGKHTFRILDLRPHGSNNKEVNIQSLTHGYFLAVTHEGVVTAVNQEELTVSEVGSGADNATMQQYFDSFVMNVTHKRNYYKVTALRDNSEDCILSFSGPVPTCKSVENFRFFDVLKVVNTRC